MISLIFATHNGAATLPRMLAALSQLRLPLGGAEVIVADNASEDATPAILAEWAGVVGPLPLAVLHEPRRGKCYALNRALKAARGELLVFTDDDVLPNEDWLEAFAHAAATHPEEGVFAGEVRHEWDAPPPPWLKSLAEAGLSYAGTPVDRPEGPIPPSQVKGPNFMVRRSFMGETRFCEDPRVNYTGTRNSAGGVETRFALDLLGREGTAWFTPASSVRHIVRAHQVGARPVFQRYIRIGAGMAHQNAVPFSTEGFTFMGYPVAGVKRAARHAAGGAYRLLRGQSDFAARKMIHLAMTLGQMQEWKRMTPRRR